MIYFFYALLGKFHGQKNFLSKVDAVYAALVQTPARNLNSLLHPTTKQHISRYVKHKAKMINKSSSLNTSPEKFLETQKLWHKLTEGSETITVPVVTLPPAQVNPPSIKPDEAHFRKYVNCPSRASSLHQATGMTHEMSGEEFSLSHFYEA
ncbi:hypothetical protein FQA47_005734 [Oryzias melastigma]|uniref:Uncharacterized protein n=1 Tax=Oryzias melastigma TaxID=30732 RepID=A0A834FSZ5_ORYME|nr:hypothetical protein FQA47_005734 [Oryzias melastigma]